MPAEDWELRREARRCLFEATRAANQNEKRMLDGFARFYTALAESADSSGQPARRIPLPGRRDRRDQVDR